MKTPHRRLFSTSNSLIVFYCLVTILYFGWATLPIRAHPLLDGTIPTTPTKTPKPTKTSTPTKTPISDSTATTSATPTNADVDTATPTQVASATKTTIPGNTATETAVATTATPTTPSGPTPTTTGTQDPTLTPTATEVAALTPTPTVVRAVLALTKTAFLFNDVDRNNLVSPGDKLLYAITLLNKGTVAAQQVRLEDPIDPNTSLVAGTLGTNKGTISQGNNAGDTQAIIEIGTIGPGERVIISLQVTIKAQVNDTQVQNQAVVSFANEVNGLSEQIAVVSDDPTTTDLLDPTITPLNGNQPRPILKEFIPFVAYQK